MMRALWNALSFLAIVHLLALLMITAWLWSSQRLTSARLAELRAYFSRPEPAAREAARESLVQAEVERLQRAQEKLSADPPFASGPQIDLVNLVRQEQEHSLRRLEDEKRLLLQQLAAVNSQLDRKQAELQQQRTSWETAIKTDRQRKIDEQFLQTVKQYEQIAPRQGKRMLIELINDNKRQQAVAYLDAMNPRAATKILKEFKTDAEIALAKQLLEELRTFGLPTDSAGREGQQDPAHADGRSSASARDLGAAGAPSQGG